MLIIIIIIIIIMNRVGWGVRPKFIIIIIIIIKIFKKYIIAIEEKL